MTRLAENRRMLEVVAEALGDLKDEVVFVGGMIAGLLITDKLVSSIRPTDDVDFIVQVATYGQYQELLQRLRQRGFSDVMLDEGPICRMKVSNILVDVLPSEGKILGFHNSFYPLAVKVSSVFTLPNGTDIRIITAPLFLCTKIEAFHDRGKGDYLTSSDLEDIISILNGRPELWEESWLAPAPARAYLRSAIADLFADEEFAEALPGLLPLGDQRRGPVVTRRMRAISECLLPGSFSGQVEVVIDGQAYAVGIISSDDCPDETKFPSSKISNRASLADFFQRIHISEDVSSLSGARKIYRIENADFQYLFDLGLLPPSIAY